MYTLTNWWRRQGWVLRLCSEDWPKLSSDYLRVISMGVSETKHLVNSQNNIFSSLSSRASQTVYPEPSEMALLAPHPSFGGRVSPPSSFFFFGLHFKITISDTVHCGRRICNKTKLSGLGSTNL